MLWFLAIVGIAVAATAGYHHLRQRDPQAAVQLVEMLREVTAVVVVLAQAVIAALEAIGRPTRSYTTVNDARGYRWSDFDE